MNSLVYVGQLIYKGLVALGTFLLNLAEAIADWGMKALGAVSQAVATVVQTAADTFPAEDPRLRKVYVLNRYRSYTGQHHGANRDDKGVYPARPRVGTNLPRGAA